MLERPLLVSRTLLNPEASTKTAPQRLSKTGLNGGVGAKSSSSSSQEIGGTLPEHVNVIVQTCSQVAASIRAHSKKAGYDEAEPTNFCSSRNVKLE